MKRSCGAFGWLLLSLTSALGLCCQLFPCLISCFLLDFFVQMCYNSDMDFNGALTL
jgi:hypothetical protein